jgi:hypothetical protein
MRVRFGGAIGLAAVMMVAACGSEDQPSTLPDPTSATATVPTTDSATPTPTGDPTAQLEAEITEFYKRYVKTINESWTSEEALQVRRSMFAESCVDCRRGYELAKRAHAERLTLEGGVISVTDISIDAYTADQVVFTTVSDSSAGALNDSSGNLVENLADSADFQITYQAERNDGGEWIITSSQVSP